MRLIEIPDDGIIRIPIMQGEDVVGQRVMDFSDYPTIEAEPVRHGRWEPTPEYDSCWCSCCKKQYTGFFASDWNYCPNCGAKMMDGDDHA